MLAFKLTKEEEQAIALVNDIDGLDVTAPAVVHIQIRADGRVAWVNVNGKCLLRACQIKELILEDERKTK